jgi:small subunit ribosomal protein S8
MVMDPIADLLTRIRNAVMVGKSDVTIPMSKLKREVVRVLKEEGYVEDFKVSEESKKSFLTITLKKSGLPIESIERVSKPGRRVYAGASDIPRVLGGHGLVIVSTPKGVMSGKQARKQSVGGELICKVY